MERLFASDGIWKRADGEVRGVAQLRTFMASRPQGIVIRHVLSNLRTTLLDDERAVVDSYVTVYRYDFSDVPSLPAPLVGPDLVGRYRDELVCEADVWKLKVREVMVDFKRPKR